MASSLHSHPNKASPKSHSKTSQRVSSKKSLVFPVLTCQSTKEPSESSEEGPPLIQNGNKDEKASNSETENATAVAAPEFAAPEALPQEMTEYKRLKFKLLKDLYTAVKIYGPNAPFTVSMLEALSRGGYLTQLNGLELPRKVFVLES
jgi:hypothetical protein